MYVYNFKLQIGEVECIDAQVTLFEHIIYIERILLNIFYYIVYFILVL